VDAVTGPPAQRPQWWWRVRADRCGRRRRATPQPKCRSSPVRVVWRSQWVEMPCAATHDRILLGLKSQMSEIELHIPARPVALGEGSWGAPWRAAPSAAGRVRLRRRGPDREGSRRAGPPCRGGPVRGVPADRVRAEDCPRVSRNGEVVPAAGLGRSVGRDDQVGQAHPRPLGAVAEEHRVRRCLRCRQDPGSTPGAARRYGALHPPAPGTRRLGGPDPVSPRGLCDLGGVPGHRGQTRGEQHPARCPAGARGHRAVSGHHPVWHLRQAGRHPLQPQGPQGDLQVRRAHPPAARPSPPTPSTTRSPRCC
jgi:hypothetical protein